MASPVAHNGTIADLAHAQGGVVGYVHPFDTVPDPAKDPVLTHELPADIAHGKVDYMEVVGFSDHKSTATVWYRLLNLGFHLPAGAGSDTMANYASLRGPVGMNRVFLDSTRDDAAMLAALKGGHGFVSNGPLLGLLVDGHKPGETIAARSGLSYRIALRSPVPVDHLELVRNGEVVKRFDLTGDRMHFDAEGALADAQGGWLLLRAWNDGADPLLLDLYPYATTNPVWLEGPVPDARGDAAYFVAWARARDRSGQRARRLQRCRRKGGDARVPARGASQVPGHGGRPLMRAVSLVVLLLASGAQAATPTARFGVDDLASLVDLTEPALSPDGNTVVYVATSANRAEDKSQSDLWRVGYDGRHRIRLTDTPKHDESRPQWSPDGTSIAFLSDRGGEDAKTQVWLIPAKGGKARRLTNFAEDIEDFVWSPDGKRLAFLARDPERPAGAPKPKQPPPIVIDRYQFKEDGVGYLDARRKHLYVFDIASGKAEVLTPGAHDEQLPAWSPDGKLLAYVTKRGVDPDRHLNFDIYVVEPRAGARNGN
jgi:hypothetical protein